MTLETQSVNGQQDPFSAPDLRFRDSRTIWGPLQLFLPRHRQGAELGYQAGQEAFQRASNLRQTSLDPETMWLFMNCYLTTPRYRPRTLTATIAAEWRAMFLLGWTSQLLEDLAHDVATTETDDQDTVSHHRRIGA